MADEIELVAASENDLAEVAEKLIRFGEKLRVFLLSGQMGAGKTALVKAIASYLGSKDHFSSPTFSIINEYHYPGGKIFHMDLYRLRTADELLDIGFEEYVYSGNYCFIEWPDLATDLLPEDCVKINISIVDNIRYFRCSHTSE